MVGTVRLVIPNFVRSELFSSLRLLQLVSNSVVIGVCKSSSSNTDDIVEFVIGKYATSFKLGNTLGDRDGSQFIKEIFRTQAPGRIVAVTMGRSCVFFELKNGTVFTYKMRIDILLFHSSNLI